MTEQEFKTGIRIKHRPRFVGQRQFGMVVAGYYDMTGRHGKENEIICEEWIVEDVTADKLERAEHCVRELLWRKWQWIIVQRS